MSEFRNKWLEIKISQLEESKVLEVSRIFPQCRKCIFDIMKFLIPKNCMQSPLFAFVTLLLSQAPLLINSIVSVCHCLPWQRRFSLISEFDKTIVFHSYFLENSRNVLIFTKSSNKFGEFLNFLAFFLGF